MCGHVCMRYAVSVCVAVRQCVQTISPSSLQIHEASVKGGDINQLDHGSHLSLS